MIYGIGYKTLSRFWSVKRMPYVIHMGRNHRQTKELLIARGRSSININSQFQLETTIRNDSLYSFLMFSKFI